MKLKNLKMYLVGCYNTLFLKSLGALFFVFLLSSFFVMSQAFPFVPVDTLGVCQETNKSWYTDNVGHVLIDPNEGHENNRNREAKDSWSFTETLPYALSLHSTFLLPNGNLMVVGGMAVEKDSQEKTRSGVFYPLESLLFNSLTQRWEAGPALNEGRLVQYASLRLSSGDFMIVSGSGSQGRIDDAIIYNMETDAFELTGQLAHGRGGHDAVELPGGRVMIAGGTDGNFTFFDSSEIYDPETSLWSMPDSKISTGRSLGRLIRLQNGEVLYIGGSRYEDSWTTRKDVDKFDPQTNTWSQHEPMLQKRQQFNVAALPDGRIIVIGGVSVQDNAIWRTTEIYDPVTSEWTSGPMLNEARANAELVTMPGGNLLVAGGQSCKSVEYLDIASMQWIRLSDMNDVRHFHSLDFLPDGNLISIGGSFEFSDIYDSAEIFSLFYASLKAKSDTINLGEIIPGETVTQSLVVHNPESRFGMIEEISFSCEGFSVCEVETPLVVAPGAELSLDFKYDGAKKIYDDLTETLTLKVKKGGSFEVVEVFLTGSVANNTSSGSLGSDAKNVSVYPNPSDGKLYIQSSSDIQKGVLLNMEGQDLYHFVSETNYYQIDTGEFKPGIYLLYLQTRNGSLVRRIVIVN